MMHQSYKVMCIVLLETTLTYIIAIDASDMWPLVTSQASYLKPSILMSYIIWHHRDWNTIGALSPLGTIFHVTLTLSISLWYCHS